MVRGSWLLVCALLGACSHSTTSTDVGGVDEPAADSGRSPDAVAPVDTTAPFDDAPPDVTMDAPPDVTMDAPPDGVTMDAPPDRTCAMSPPGPIGTRTCPSCIEGRWSVHGSSITGYRDGFSLEISGCAPSLRCLVEGEEHQCFWASDQIRVYVDRIGYRQLLFTSIACDRMLGAYISKGGGGASMRAEYEGPLSDAGAMSDACVTASTDAVARRAPCGPCGARLSVNDAGVEECERFTNPCGGCTVLSATPGSACGPDRYYFCSGPDGVECNLGSADGLNACGWRSGTLSHAPGDRCGSERECRYVCQLMGPERRETLTCWCPPGGDAGVSDVTVADVPGDARPVLEGAAQVVAGTEHTCARMLDGTVRCWGDGGGGQLGDGARERRTTPTLVPGLANVVELTARASHTCARTSDGGVWCWGDNYWGQLGDGTALSRLVPTRVAGLTGVAQIATGTSHTCARMTDGTARCWGGNLDGELGDGTNMFRLSPTIVPGLAGVRDLVVGTSHTCARMADMSPRCWGRNATGELGDGSTTDRSVPTVITALNAATQVSLGASYGCAQMSDATVRCWGTNFYNQLGFEAPSAGVTTPTEVPSFTGVSGVAAGREHTCAWMADTTARCWGQNRFGALGDGTTTARTAPTPVVGLAGVVEIALGDYHSCARTSDGRVRCWGANSNGQLGDDTTRDRLAPPSAP